VSVPDDIYQRLAQLEAQVRYLYERTGTPLPGYQAWTQTGLPPEAQQELAKGNKIAAIKAYRQATGCDLATAKKAVESYM
jgi:hypothetical protein